MTETTINNFPRALTQHPSYVNIFSSTDDLSRQQQQQKKKHKHNQCDHLHYFYYTTTTAIRPFPTFSKSCRQKLCRPRECSVIVCRSSSTVVTRGSKHLTHNYYLATAGVSVSQWQVTQSFDLDGWIIVIVNLHPLVITLKRCCPSRYQPIKSESHQVYPLSRPPVQ